MLFGDNKHNTQLLSYLILTASHCLSYSAALLLPWLSQLVLKFSSLNLESFKQRNIHLIPSFTTKLRGGGCVFLFFVTFHFFRSFLFWWVLLKKNMLCMYKQENTGTYKLLNLIISFLHKTVFCQILLKLLHLQWQYINLSICLVNQLLSDHWHWCGIHLFSQHSNLSLQHRTMTIGEKQSKSYFQWNMKTSLIGLLLN